VSKKLCFDRLPREVPRRDEIIDGIASEINAEEFPERDFVPILAEQNSPGLCVRHLSQAIEKDDEKKIGACRLEMGNEISGTRPIKKEGKERSPNEKKDPRDRLTVATFHELDESILSWVCEQVSECARVVAL
jgi:hypothetical protein